MTPVIGIRSASVGHARQEGKGWRDRGVGVFGAEQVPLSASKRHLQRKKPAPCCMSTPVMHIHDTHCRVGSQE